MAKAKHHDEIHKFLFGSVALLFLIAFVSVMTYQNSAITANVVFEQGKTIQNIAFVDGGEIRMEVKNIPSLSTGILHINGLIKGGQVTFYEEFLAFDGATITAFSVETSHEAEISGIDLTFKVPIEKQQEADIFKEEITLYTHAGIAIPTTYVETDERFHFYTATIESFESYVLGLKNEVEVALEEPVEVTEEVVPIQQEEIIPEPAPVVEPVQEEGFFSRLFNWLS